MLSLLEAINVRKSVRTYTGEAVGENDAAEFNKKIAELNEESGLSIQFVQNSPETFAKSFCGIKGADSFFAMVGKEDDTYLLERVGYYGEQLVLLATALGYGTCWVSITYDRDKCPC